MTLFLFTDIEGSTKKWEKYAEAMKRLLPQHDSILKETVEKSGGHIVKYTGDGIFAVFEKGEPLLCALEIQKRIEKEDWSSAGELRIRIAIHAGVAEKRGADYFGPVVNRTARLLDVGWGGQILLTPEAVKSSKMPAGGSLKDLGVHLLKDLGEPQQIYELTHPELVLKKFPPLRTLSSHPHNLPSQASPFLGRAEELSGIMKALEDPSCRLLTLVGLGGIGKTRLSLQAAAQRIETFRHGVYFVPLASQTISSTTILVFSIADALKFSFFGKEDPKIQLLNYLREKEMLLVMDNFEHLVAESGLLSEILDCSPHIKFLVTSRIRLSLREEWIIEVKGMSFPASEKVEDMESYSAVRLFVQNARKVSPRFSLTEKDKPWVVRICQTVEGMPLGIELASVWVKMLSCEAIAQEIEKSLDFLTSSLRNIPDRHRSLKGVFNHSWDLLPEKEKRAFRKISVFRAGFSLEAGENVAGARLSMLASLVDKSLLHRKPTGRYEIHEVLRQYAEESLNESPDKEAVGELHCRYYAGFAQRWTESIGHQRHTVAIRSLIEDFENIRSAWLWAVNREREDVILTLAKSLYLFYDVRGRYREAEEMLNLAYDKLKVKGASLVLGSILFYQGNFHYHLGLIDKAWVTYQESLGHFKKIDARKNIAECLNQLGFVAHVRGDYEEAKRNSLAAMAIAEELKLQSVLGLAYRNLGVIAQSVGDYATAQRMFEQNLGIRRALGEIRSTAVALGNLGILAYHNHNLSEAERLFQESLKIFKDLDDEWSIAASLNSLGAVAEAREDYGKARQLYEESLSRKKDLGERRGEIISLGNLGNIFYRQGDYREARAYYHQALKAALTSQIAPVTLETLSKLAVMSAEEANYEKAAELFFFIREQPQTEKLKKEDCESELSKLKTRLSAEVMERARRKLSGKKLEEVIEDVLRDGL